MGLIIKPSTINMDLDFNQEELLYLLEDILGEPKKINESHNQIAYDCPKCAEIKGIYDGTDGKGNLEVNYVKNVFNCWSCGPDYGTHGNIFKLIKSFGSDEQLSKFNQLNLNFEHFDGDDNNLIRYYNSELVKLPKEYWSLSKDDEIVENKYTEKFLNYLRSRNISDDLIIKYRIGYAINGKYANRVIIPSYNKFGQINYFIARHISPHKKFNKYLNSDNDKQSIIFNEDLIDYTKPIRLVEGPIDHLVTENSIPLLGKVLFEILLTKIYQNNPPKVIIILDPDAIKEAKIIYHQLNTGKLKDKIYICKLHPNLDAAKFVEDFGLVEWEKYIELKSNKLKENYYING